MNPTKRADPGRLEVERVGPHGAPLGGSSQGGVRASASGSSSKAGEEPKLQHQAPPLKQGRSQSFSIRLLLERRGGVRASASGSSSKEGEESELQHQAPPLKQGRSQSFSIRLLL
ncbi:unnamed protein product [Pleuronectes platessa]|uniref:Uncharacterized protein n=1 Tax=Pleuronectes platessa TaxID=8262 RepID=A0A9N7V665_PLEPL|nr:unnamed protein product [Pleuronectes platessa]